MGFYGNISNTVKTTFQFDKIYSNHTQMDERCALGDGVFPGRYVLIDYDQPMEDGVFNLKNELGLNTDEKYYWLYNDIMYSGTPTMIEIEGKNFYTIPLAALKVDPKIYTEWKAGKMALIQKGRRVTVQNPDSSEFIRITSITIEKDEENVEHYSYTASIFSPSEATPLANLTKIYAENVDNVIKAYTEADATVTAAKREETIKKRIKDTFKRVNLTEEEYEIGLYFNYDKTSDTYILNEDDYDSALEYYEKKPFSTEDEEFDIFITTEEKEVYDEQWGITTVTYPITYTSTIKMSSDLIYRVPKGHRYTVNHQDEIWQITGTTTSDEVNGEGLEVAVVDFTWGCVLDDNVDATDNYYRNLSIDRSSKLGIHHRGYDSTVWQKVVKGDRDTYVMVAELNSVVPTFDIAFDPPTLIPLVPHFDKNSTDVYYKLHTQPQWGFRVKAANPDLTGPTIDTAGNFGSVEKLRDTSDSVIYPSDQNVKWEGTFYNTYTGEEKKGKYAPELSTWVKPGSENDTDDYTNVPAAIYFNKKGFDPLNISYSSDLITKGTRGYDPQIKESRWKNDNKIEFTPTGKSGQEYYRHGNGQAKMEPDTQELSVMLPALGDTISAIWDLVYGGRGTNEKILANNRRNMDIEWEDAKGSLARNGLRMHDYRNNNSFNRAQVNTLAGCINSVHDLMGMIIMSSSPQYYATKLAHLDEDRIYHVANFDDTNISLTEAESVLAEEIAKQKGLYTRKHKTYTYEPVKEDTHYTMDKITDTSLIEDFDPKNYYVLVDGKYVQATEENIANCDEDPVVYYKKILKESAIYDKVTSEMQTWQGQYYYRDINGQERKGDLYYDYIKDMKYQKGHQYYTVTAEGPLNLAGAYEPGKYYKHRSGSYLVDYNDEATLNEIYYTINENKVSTVSSSGYDGIYVPGKYYRAVLKTNEDGEEYIDFELDMSPDGLDEGGGAIFHYAVKTQDAKPGETVDYVYVEKYIPLTGEDAEKIRYSTPIYKTSGGNYVQVLENETLSATGTYFVKQIVYTPVTGELEIDKGNPLTLIGYQANTFFLRQYEDEETKDKLLGYIPLAKEAIVDYDPTKQEVYVFGKRESTTVPFVSVDDGLTMETYALQRQSNFYTSGEYHYIDENGSYVLDTYPQQSRDKYYKLKSVKLQNLDGQTFYEPNEYYEKTENGEYVLVRDPEKPEDVKEYYKGNQFFIKEDKAKIYEPGAEWNIYVTQIPPTVTLAKRTAKWELKPIEDFARNLNTMHGLILKINNMLEMGDSLTRDDFTVQGTINKMRDLIARFDKLEPEKFMLVDNYGRITGFDWDTLQTDTAQKDKNASDLLKNTTGDVFPKLTTTTGGYNSSTQKYDKTKMRNQWITLSVDGTVDSPKLRVHHNFQPVTDTSANTDLNAVTTGTIIPKVNYMTLKIPHVDAMGHVVGMHSQKYTLPFGFKTFGVTGTSTGVTGLTGTTDVNIVAENPIDALTFITHNKWIDIKADNTKDNKTITLGHKLTDISANKGKDYGLSSDMTVAQVDAASNKFNVPVFQFDEAGHVTKAETHTIALPDGFTSFKSAVSSVEDADSENGLAATINPDTMTDTMTFAEGNKWINISGDTNNDKFTFSHYVKAFSESTSTLDFNKTESGEEFTVQSIKWDRAGHIIESDKKTFTLPKSFKNLAVTNTGSAAVGLGSATAGTVVANNLVGTATFDAGNRWLALAADVNTDKITFYHTAPDSSSSCTNTTQTGNETPSFGATFKIPEVKYDETGHIFKVGTHDVTIPKNSLTDANATGSDLITQIKLNPTTGAFTTTRTKLSELTLEGYAEGEDNSDVKAEDTLGEALSKLQLQIKDEEDVRAQAIKDAIEALDYEEEIAEDETIEGTYIETVTQTDGIVSVTRKTLPTTTISDIALAVDEENLVYEAPGEDETDFDDKDKTIAWLFKKVAQLEARIIELETPTEPTV